MFPEKLRIHFGDWLNGLLDWLVEKHGDSFEAISDAILACLVALDQALRALPWWLVILVAAALAYHSSKKIMLALTVSAALFVIGLLGLWDKAMQTLAIVMISVACSILIGLPLGIAMSQSKILRLILNPILDIMQTMPSFVYLIPALMLFGLGKVPAILATIIYAMPPLTRLTDLGVRMVDPSIVEAANAFGANRTQRLMTVQIPLALPSIMQGINQTTMMALAMVVIASMIGAGGLGGEVLAGIRKLDIGQGAEAGLAIVALAIVFDRITQAYGASVQKFRTSR